MPEAVPQAAGLTHAIFADTGPDLTSTSPVAILPNGDERTATIVDLASDTSDDPTAAQTTGLYKLSVVVGANVTATLYFTLEAGDDDPTSVRFGLNTTTTLEIESYGVVGSLFTLDGTRSVDDGVIDTYTWAQTGGPYKFASQTGDLIGVLPQSAGTYVFTLVVTDNIGLRSATRTLRVQVVPAGDAAVGPPKASASITSGGTTLAALAPNQVAPGITVSGTVGGSVTLSASASASRNGGTLTYSWSQLSGPTVALTDTTSATLSFSPTTSGAHQFQVTTTDGNGVNDIETIWVTVAPIGRDAPVAEIAAVAVQTLDVTTGSVTVTLNGQNSTGDSSLTYQWEQTLGVPVFIEASTGGTAQFTATQAGTYEFSLRVNDGFVLSSPATRTVIVEAPDNTALASGATFSESDGGCALSPTRDGSPLGGLALLAFLLGLAGLRRRSGAA